MSLAREHEIHKRRFGRNLGLGLALGGFATLTFAVTVAKFQAGEPTQDFEQTLQVEQLQTSQ